MNDLKKLYSETIKAHNDAPYHFEKKNESPICIKAYNPICGDRFDIFMSISSKIDSIHFHGFGCAISKASTSVLAKSMEGKELSEAKKICADFLQFIDQKPVDHLTLPEEWLAFGAVRDFQERYDCATLSWREMKRKLETIH